MHKNIGESAKESKCFMSIVVMITVLLLQLWSQNYFQGE